LATSNATTPGILLDSEFPIIPAPLGPMNLWVYALAVVATLIHFLCNGRYGYFRDELYYAACGQYPAWGYLDHAPLAPWIAQASRKLGGDSLFALRFVPALAGAVKVLLAGWMAREMGGRKFAQVFAALLTLVAPIYLTFDNFLSMNSFEPVLWMTCAAVVLRILNGGDRRLWLLFGAVAGIALLNKHSMLFFGSGLTVGLLMTPARREFRYVWIWLGAGIALLLFLPNLMWEVHEGFPTIALLQHVIGGKYATVSRWEFLWQQTLLTLPIAAPIWLGGLWFLFADLRGRRYAVLGWAYVVVLAEMMWLHGKIYYLAPAYIMLLAAGTVWLEGQEWVAERRWAQSALIAMFVTAGVIAAPLAMPVLPVELAIRYARFWDVQAVHVENVPQDELPQLFGDMFGWEEQAAAVARAYRGLPEEEQKQAAVLAYNYGEAGAIDYFGPRYGLPKAISGHNQYGLWGARRDSLGTVVAIGFPRRYLEQFFAKLTPAAYVNPAHALPEERNLTVFVCRQPRMGLSEMWAKLRYLN
jgi:hypothetical protein